MELSKEAGIQKEKFKIKVIPSDLPRRLFEVFDILRASYPHLKQKIKSKLNTSKK
jgi:hypothetical protein